MITVDRGSPSTTRQDDHELNDHPPAHLTSNQDYCSERTLVHNRQFLPTCCKRQQVRLKKLAERRDHTCIVKLAQEKKYLTRMRLSIDASWIGGEFQSRFHWFQVFLSKYTWTCLYHVAHHVNIFLYHVMCYVSLPLITWHIMWTHVDITRVITWTSPLQRVLSPTQVLRLSDTHKGYNTSKYAINFKFPIITH